MTLSTSLVAVWYSSDSCKSCVRCRNSVINLAFSIAITACAAKFQQRNLLVGKEPHLLAVDHHKADHRVVLAQRHDQPCTGAPEIDQGAAMRVGGAVRLLVLEIGDMDKALALQDARPTGPGTGRRRVVGQIVG